MTRRQILFGEGWIQINAGNRSKWVLEIISVCQLTGGFSEDSRRWHENIWSEVPDFADAVLLRFSLLPSAAEASEVQHTTPLSGVQCYILSKLLAITVLLFVWSRLSLRLAAVVTIVMVPRPIVHRLLYSPSLGSSLPSNFSWSKDSQMYIAALP